MKINRATSSIKTKAKQTLATEKVEVYVLDVRVPKMDSRRVTVKGEVSLGSDAGCDIRIQEHGLAPLQGRFRLQNDVLTFTNLGPDNSLKVGSQKCGHGRMYILDKGDKCIIEKVKLIVRKEKVEQPLENREEDEAQEQDASLDELNEAEEKEESQDILSADKTDEADITDQSLKRVESSRAGEEEYEIVEEVVYVDEDGNEVEKPQEPNFFSHFKNLVKKKENSKKKVQKASGATPKITKGKKIRDPVAGPLYRFTGFAYNLVFFLLIYKLAFPLIKDKLGFDLFKHVADLHKMVLPHLKKTPVELPEPMVVVPQVAEYYTMGRDYLLSLEVFNYVTLYAGYEILFNFILGIGLGYFLIGMNNGGHFIAMRALAPLRVLINMVTMPFLVFDFPVIFSKRSFKEITTFSRYQRRSPALTLFLALIVLPLLGVLGANYKIYPALIEVKPKMMAKVSDLKKDKAAFKEEEFDLKSISFNISNAKAFTGQATAFIPSISATKKGILPQIIAIDSVKGHTAEIIQRTTRIDIEKTIDFIKRDPLLGVFNPELDQAIKSNQKDAKNKIPLDRRQLIKVLFYSLSLDIKSPLPAIKNLGIILSPYYELQSFMFEQMKTKRVSTVDLINGSKDSMIVLGNNDTLANKYLLRIDGDSIQLTDVSYKATAKKFTEDTLDNLFYHSAGYNGKYTKTINAAAKSGDINVRSFAALDIMRNVIEGKKVNQAESKIVSDLYIALCTKALKTESNEYQQTLLDNFEELDKILIKLKLRNKDSRLGDLRLTLNRIQEALYKRDQSFFNLNTEG